MKLKNSLATFALLGLSTWHSHAFEARVLVLEKCPVNNSTKQIEEAGALGVALLAKLVGAVAGTAIDGLVSALSDVKKVSAESAERLPGWYSKVQGSETVTINPNLVCVVTLVAPELSNRNETADAAPSEKLYDEIAKTLTEPKSERAHRRMRSGAATLAKYGVVGPPSFYMESIFVKNASGTVFALQPAFVYYPRFLGKRSHLVLTRGTSFFNWNSPSRKYHCLRLNQIGIQRPQRIEADRRASEWVTVAVVEIAFSRVLEGR